MQGRPDGPGCAADGAVRGRERGDDESHEDGGEEDGDEALHRVLLGRREEHARSLRAAGRPVVDGRDIGNVTAAT